MLCSTMLLFRMDQRRWTGSCMCVKEAVNQPKNNGYLNSPKFGGVIGLCSYLRAWQRQKEVVVLKKLM